MSVHAVDITNLIRDTASGMSRGQMIHSAVRYSTPRLLDSSVYISF